MMSGLLAEEYDPVAKRMCWETSRKPFLTSP